MSRLPPSLPAAACGALAVGPAWLDSGLTTGLVVVDSGRPASVGSRGVAGLSHRRRANGRPNPAIAI